MACLVMALLLLGSSGFCLAALSRSWVEENWIALGPKKTTKNNQMVNPLGRRRFYALPGSQKAIADPRLRSGFKIAPWLGALAFGVLSLIPLRQQWAVHTLWFEWVP